MEGRGGSGVPRWPLSFYVGKLKSGKERDRVYGIRAIGYFGADGAPAVAELMAALSDASAEVRGAAADALGQIGSAGEPVVAGLAKALSDTSPRVRVTAAIALEGMGKKAVAAIPELIHALNDPVNYVRASAANVFGAMGPAASLVVGPLTEKLLLKDEDRFVRGNAAYALGESPWRRRALPRFKKPSKHADGMPPQRKQS